MQLENKRGDLMHAEEGVVWQPMKNIKCTAGSNVLYVDVGSTYEENKNRLILLLDILYGLQCDTLEGIATYFEAEGITYSLERYSF